ncbi:aromatic ring-hydroxylating dioxygenase subunit alpha [Novosphingobium terrae]|uniref:aromatic ring-hydroxylating dioxygenase subunit alpha n=1 Tax=Novosphingobium terrae TaxID=2726189 RepID=UPI00198055AD|nr:aromatic ring-hydroxylating dioxygenase subunit alpha [Novosphingobium terrae]
MAQQSSPTLADVHTPPLHNHWYVAGYADEFDEGLHERMFLDRSIVIYRKQDGDLVGLQNRCAHRSFPLAHGWREGDTLRCRYHGARYDAEGRLVEIPSMAACPRVSVRRYPMRIAGPLAWIWMGPPDAPGPLPETPWLGEGWTYATGQYPLQGNWLLMAENLMDLTHIPFLHASTFAFPKGFAQAPIKLEVAGERLSFYRDNPPAYHRSGMMRPALSDALEAAGFTARSTVEFVSPALTFGRGEFFPTQGAMPQPDYMWRVAHFMTPETQGRTHYWYFHARNYDLADAALTEQIRALVVAGFDEDKFAIEQIQRMHDEDRHAYSEVQFRSDAPAVAMRRIVAAMAAREAQA